MEALDLLWILPNWRLNSVKLVLSLTDSIVHDTALSHSSTALTRVVEMLGNIVQKNALRVREATTKCLMSDISIPIDESEADADYMQSADQRLEDEAIVDQAIAETVTSGFFARHLPMLLSCACVF